MSALPARAAISVSASRSRRAAMLALTCSMCSVLASHGCGNDAPPANRPRPGMVSANPTNSSTTQPMQGPDAVRNQPIQQPGLSSGRLESPPAAAESKAPEPAEKKARDYSAELKGLLSSSVSCLTGHKADARSAITINVSAQVMPSGSISRADAQGPGLSPVELSCIQKVVGTLRLNGPIDGAPRSVSAHLTLQSQATKEVPQPKAAADSDDNDREENPHETQLKEVNNDPPEVAQHDQPVREAPEPAEPRDEPAREDTHAE
jgi:hypothetical protein